MVETFEEYESDGPTNNDGLPIATWRRAVYGMALRNLLPNYESPNAPIKIGLLELPPAILVEAVEEYEKKHDRQSGFSDSGAPQDWRSAIEFEDRQAVALHFMCSITRDNTAVTDDEVREWAQHFTYDLAGSSWDEFVVIASYLTTLPFLPTFLNLTPHEVAVHFAARRSADAGSRKRELR